MNKPKIIVTGMCDTKFTELKFLAEQVKKAGGEVKIVNVGCGKPCDWTDVSLQEVLDVNGIKQEDVFKLPRAEAIKVVGEAGEKKIMQMYEAGEVDGIISWAGSMGTTTVPVTDFCLSVFEVNSDFLSALSAQQYFHHNVLVSFPEHQSQSPV